MIIDGRDEATEKLITIATKKKNKKKSKTEDTKTVRKEEIPLLMERGFENSDDYFVLRLKLPEFINTSIETDIKKFIFLQILSKTNIDFSTITFFSKNYTLIMLIKGNEKKVQEVIDGISFYKQKRNGLWNLKIGISSIGSLADVSKLFTQASYAYYLADNIGKVYYYFYQSALLTILTEIINFVVLEALGNNRFLVVGVL